MASGLLPEPPVTRLLPCLLVFLSAGLAGPALACDMPSIAPTDIPLGDQADGRRLHVVTGTLGICDPAAREAEIDLGALHDLRGVKVQLSIAGFARRYGVHQIGFSLQAVEAVPTPKGVKIRYTATVDGLDRYQLAYTLYLSAGP